MANEELTISKDKARLTVIGNSYPDALTDSGLGLDLSQIIFDILIDLDIPMPDIDLDDLDDITIIPGLDIDTEIPTLEYPDPDWPDDEIPPIIDWPMPDLNWDDFIDKLEDLGIDPNILIDLSFVGLNDLELPTLVSLDMDFNIQMDELPASIEIVTPPNKLEYQDGERIDLIGMVVTAKKADGSTWTNVKYPNGHIPLGELIIEPTLADVNETSMDTKKEWPEFGQGPWPQPINAASGEVGDETSSYKPAVARYDGYIAFLLGEDDYRDSSFMCSASPGVGYWDSGTGSAPSNIMVNTPYTYNGKTVYYGSMGSGIKYHALTGGVNHTVSTSGDGLNIAKAAWVILYGIPVSIGGEQTINVGWARYGDGELLSTSFEIEVTDPGGGGR